MEGTEALLREGEREISPRAIRAQERRGRTLLAARPLDRRASRATVGCSKATRMSSLTPKAWCRRDSTRMAESE